MFKTLKIQTLLLFFLLLQFSHYGYANHSLHNSNLSPKINIFTQLPSPDSENATQTHISPTYPSVYDDYVIVMIGSAGGYDAFEKILSKLPQNHPPIVFLEHVGPYYEESLYLKEEAPNKKYFYDRAGAKLISKFRNRITNAWYHYADEVPDKRMKKKIKLSNGVIVITSNARIKKENTGIYLDSYPLYNETFLDKVHIPIISKYKNDLTTSKGDQLLLSAAESLEKNMIGVILSGTGEDGSFAVDILNEQEILTIAQSDASTSLNPKTFFGSMPENANTVLKIPADEIYSHILKYIFNSESGILEKQTLKSA